MLLPQWAWRHRNTKYRIAEDHIGFTTGVFRKQEKTVPFERMHDINTVQNFVQRLFGVTTIQIQTAGGSGIDLELKGVKLGVVDELRDLKRQYELNTDGEPVTEDPRDDSQDVLDAKEAPTLLEISWLDCLKLSLIRNPALALLGAGFVYLYNQFSDLITRFFKLIFNEYGEVATLAAQDYVNVTLVDRGIPWISVSINYGADWITLLVFLSVMAIVLIVLVVGSSFAIMLVLYHGFTLRISGDTLLVHAGSLVRTERKTPLYRIQFTKTIRSLRHRMMGVESVYFNTSAASDTKGLVEKMLARWLTPVSLPHESRDVIRGVFSSISLNHDAWLGIESEAWKRRFKKHMGIFLPIAGALILTNPWLVVLVAVIIGFLAFEAVRFVDRVAYQLSRDAIFARRGWWVQNSIIVPFSKVQQVCVNQTYFDRQYRMATLRIETASDTRAFTIELPYLDIEKARALSDRIYAEARGRIFEW